jgi:lipopolysaccharide export system permease protein
LSAGISTQRVIRPVLVSAVIVSLIAVANHELLMPVMARELLLDHRDDGTGKVKVVSRDDANKILIHGQEGDRESKTIFSFNATTPPEIFGEIWMLEAKQATYIPRDDPKAPLKGGWLLRGSRLRRTAADPKDLETGLITCLKSTAGFPPPVGAKPNLAGETYFLRTELTFDAVTRKRLWYKFASTPDLVRGLGDPANEPVKVDIAVFLHTRILRPAASLTLMLLSLPFVLNGFGRNMFINLGLALATSGVFYGVGFMSQFLGSSGIVSPELSAWAPLIGFGTIAVARWDQVRT